MLGLRCMIYILQHPYNKKIILRKNLTQVKMPVISFKILIIMYKLTCIAII